MLFAPLNAMAKALPTGKVRQAAEFRAIPKLWYMPFSLNSAKAAMCLRLSSVNEAAERVDLGVEGQYDFECAQLNPNMTVPFLEVEDKVITDSRLIADHLFQKYPGAGDRKAISEGQKESVIAFVDTIAEWDEAVWCFTHIGEQASMANIPRYMKLHQQALLANQKGSELPLVDGMSMEDVYLKKIAGLRYFESMLGSDPGAEDYQRNNEIVYEQIWAKANELLAARQSQDFLFGAELTTADALFVPFLYRIGFVAKVNLEENFQQYPRVRQYWQQVQATKEAKCVTAYGKQFVAKVMLQACLPCKIASFKCGGRKYAALPAEMNRKIEAFIDEKRKGHLSK